MTTDRRPDPDALLARLHLEGARPGRGRLKVFFGANAGVGKTFTMLEEARQRRREGADVVVGYVETHGRRETEALLDGLDLLPRAQVEHRGIRLPEFDLDAALARRPALILVDELAHSNAPGSRHAKRWQDVEELRAAGIDVFTTLNVQHLESLNDLVARITSVRVRETVPDTVLAGADEVELIDIPPEELLKRLADGKVYLADQAARAREHFFTRPNLTALRQLALRQVATRVDDQMRVYRRAGSVDRTWPVAERILVGVGPAPSSRRLVRAARRMADQLGAEWIALFVETPEYAGWPEADRASVWETMRLAEQLGARTVTVSGTDPAEEIVRHAREHNVSKLVVGKPSHPRWRDRVFGSKLDQVARRSGDVDVYVISGDAEESPPPARRPSPPPPEGGWRRYAAAVAAALAATGVSALLFGRVEPTTQAMIYLLAVAAVAAGFGRGPAVLSAILGVAAFDFFFVSPYLTFAVSDTEYLLTFAVMLAVGLGIGTLTARLKRQGELFRRRERRTAALYDLARDLQRETTRDDVLSAGLRQVGGVFGAETAAFLADDAGRLRAWGDEGGGVDPTEMGILYRVFQHARPAGAGTDTLPGADGLYLPLTGSHGVGGVVRVRTADPWTLADPERLHFLEAFVGQLAGSLERIRLAEEAARGERLREMDRARTRFVALAAHRLRLPARRLERAMDDLRARLAPDEAGDDGALDDAAGEARALRALVDDLLELSRLEGGRTSLSVESTPPAEIVRRAVDAFAARAAERGIAVEWECDGARPPVLADPARAEDALGRLLANALRFTGAGGTVFVSADALPDAVQFSVAESGMEIPPEAQARIFDAFVEVPGEEAGAGTGLGLPIARAIVEAHGGAIWVDSGPGPGSVFSFTLPLARPEPAPAAPHRGVSSGARPG